MAKLRVDRFVPRAWRTSPRFAPLWLAASIFDEAEAWPEVDEYNDDAAAAVRFVAQARPRPAADEPGYVETILGRREVPTRRANWHDFFNMLVWRTFPRAKWALTRGLARASEDPAPRGANGRTRAQDRLAMIDEGGVVVIAPAAAHPSIVDRLRATSSGLAAPDLGDAAVIVFGHAIYEHLVVGTGPVRGLAILIADESLPSRDLDAIDGWLAAALERGELTAGEKLGAAIGG